MDSVSHFELPATDRKRANNFYHNTFGWVANEVPGIDYTLVTTGPSDQKTGRPTNPGNINGGIGNKTGPLTHPVITIAVNDIDAAITKITKNGGKVVKSKEKMGDQGLAAYFQDTEGNVVGLWQASGPR